MTGLILFAIGLISADGPDLEHFEKKIRPLLVEQCQRCHDADKTKGGLRLDSAEAIAQGGDTGELLVPGKPDVSLLIQAVRYAGDLKMPPKGKLPEADIAALVDWVQAGAPWPTEPEQPKKPAPSTVPEPVITPDQRAFWAFQPVLDPLLPPVKDPAWAGSPIDRFILAGQEAHGLTHAGQADKRTLIRRTTFDLTGLPPTISAVDAFLEDSSPAAYARVVDRLLASPAYGVRWGRHWLDLARYADSNGMDENIAYANAWRYRDYVVASFNADKPYDQLLKEQIAGDLLPAAGEVARQDQVTGTGFLVLGPKMLAEDDPMKMEMDIIDEQVDTVGKVFMGLTLGCARCHDHKFDPIPTADYYSLAGIFKSTKSMQNHSVVAMWNEQTLATAEEQQSQDAYQKQVAASQDDLNTFVSDSEKPLRQEAREQIASYLLAAADAWRAKELARSMMTGQESGSAPAGQMVREAEEFNRGNVVVDRENYGQGIGVILNGGPQPNFAEYDFTIEQPGLYQVEVRYAAAESRPIRVQVRGETLAESVAERVTGSWNPDNQAWTVAGMLMLEAGPVTVRVERPSGPIPHIDKLALVPITLPEGMLASEVLSTTSVAQVRKLNPRLLQAWVETLTKAKSDPNSLFATWHDMKWLDQTPSAGPLAKVHALLARAPRPATQRELAGRYQELFTEALAATPEVLNDNAGLAEMRKVADAREGPITLPENVDEWLGEEVRKQLTDRRDSHKKLQDAAPPVRKAMAVEERKPTNLRIHIRGSHTTLGAEVPRQFLRVIAGDQQQPIGDTQSGRLELAEWLTRPGHPLTARVMANRIWQWHFGQGLVRSSDNFGELGERPSHPELLDWLAARFVESGWSIKAMHRFIMLSSTYQMSTQLDEAAALADPDNQQLWRIDRRRLEAEAIRDALVAVAGDLDYRMEGSRLQTKNHDYVNSTGGTESSEPYDTSVRSIYLPVIRSGLYAPFQAFDFADPSSSNGRRTPTTVAPQALFMMNSKVVLKSSSSWAKRLLARTDLDDAGRIALAYKTAYARPATGPEIGRAQSYLARFDSLLQANGVADAERKYQAWQALCQALMATSEFLTID